MTTIIWNFKVETLQDCLENTEAESLFLIGLRNVNTIYIFGSYVIDNILLSEIDHIRSIIPLNYDIVGIANPSQSSMVVCKSELIEPYVVVSNNCNKELSDICLSDGSILLSSCCDISLQLPSYQWLRVLYPISFTVPINCSDAIITAAADTALDSADIILVGDPAIVVDSSTVDSWETILSTSQYRVERTESSEEILCEIDSNSVEKCDQFYMNIPQWMSDVHTLCRAEDLMVHSSTSVMTSSYRMLEYNLDVIMCVSLEQSANHIIPLLKQALHKQCSHCTSNLYPYHFVISPQLPITLFQDFLSTLPTFAGDDIALYRSSVKSDLREWRSSLHRKFNLSKNWPYFRYSCSLFESTNESQLLRLSHQKGILLSVHEHLKSIDNALYIEGKYFYFHYGQQDFNDKGWGCAYRSLQTLCSFFILNHFYDLEIPTINEIQKLLVTIGDKPSSFVGTKGWIGSQEVGFVLNSLYDVDCKYIILDKGEDIKNHIKRLIDHFLHQKTPIMIGGGVLAFTCLGVAYNENSKEFKLLILDPHYSGPDDLTSVVNEKQNMEGYRGMCCGWKLSKEVFANKNFYRVCLPQRPNVL